MNGLVPFGTGALMPLCPRSVHEVGGKPSFPFHRTIWHPPRKAELEPVPTYFWPLVTLLFSVSVSLICWGAYDALPQMAAAGEKHLRQALLSSKVNPKSAGAPRVEVAELDPEPYDSTVLVPG